MSENGVESEVRDMGRLLKWMRLDRNRWRLRLQKVKIQTPTVNSAIGRLITEIEAISLELSRKIESKMAEIPEWEHWFKYIVGASANLFAQIYAHIDWSKVKSCSSLPSFIGIGKEQGNKYVKSLVIQQATMFCGYNSPMVKKLRMGAVRVKSSAYARFFQDEILRYAKEMVNGNERFRGFTPRNLALYCLTNTAQLWLSHLTMVHFWLERKMLFLPYSVTYAGHNWIYLPPFDKKNNEDWIDELEESIYDQGIKPVTMESEVRSEEEMRRLLPKEYIERLS
jgi:hypothetical protein